MAASEAPRQCGLGILAHVQAVPIEFVDLKVGRRRHRLAVNRDRNDPYTERLRAGRGSTRVATLLLSLTEAGESVIDAGANVGTVALPLAVQGRRVLAIEAMAENYVLLLEAGAATELDELVPVHAAVAAEPGLLDITGHSAFARVELNERPGSTPAVTLDALCAAHGFADASVLKIDVEGSELDALAGARRLLSSPGLRYVFYEANGAHCQRVGHRPLEIAQRLHDEGFEVFTLYDKTMVPIEQMPFQTVGNTDCLASRPGAPRPRGFTVGTLDTATQVAGVVEALGAANHGYRRFILGELPHAGEAVLGDPAVQRALSELRDDTTVNLEIRKAATRLL